MFEETRRYVKTLGLPEGDLNDLPTSDARFPDGAAYRIEDRPAGSSRSTGAAGNPRVSRGLLELTRESKGLR